MYDRISVILANHISEGKKCKRAQKMLDEEICEGETGMNEKELKRLTSRDQALKTLAQLLKVMKAIREYSTEFGLALMHYNGRPGSSHLESPCTVPGFLLRDPFIVGAKLARKTQETLGIQTKKLEAFVCEDSDEPTSEVQ